MKISSVVNRKRGYHRKLVIWNKLFSFRADIHQHIIIPYDYNVLICPMCNVKLLPSLQHCTINCYAITYPSVNRFLVNTCVPLPDYVHTCSDIATLHMRVILTGSRSSAVLSTASTCSSRSGDIDSETSQFMLPRGGSRLSITT
jgi:hypothetical protein